jgi:hypothetical protein
MKIRFLTIALFFVVAHLFADDKTNGKTELGKQQTNVTLLSLNGTFSGSGSDSTGPGQMTWILTQTNTTVRGTVTAKTQLGTVAFKGTIYGTISNTTLNFAIVIPKGGISDLPNCTSDILGSATGVTNTSIRGTYTGNCSCTGSFQNGKFTLAKQNTP